MKIKRFFGGKNLTRMSLLIMAYFVPAIAQNQELFPNSHSKSFSFRAMEAATNYYWSNPNGWPPTLEALVPKYLQSIPDDGVTGSKKVVSKYDGTGGWVYNKLNGDVYSNAPTSVSKKTLYKPNDFYGKWTVKAINKVAPSVASDGVVRKAFKLVNIIFKEKECYFLCDKISNPKYVIHSETTAKRNSNFESPHLDSYEYGYHSEREEIIFLDVKDKKGFSGEIEIISDRELVYYSDGYICIFEKTELN